MSRNQPIGPDMRCQGSRSKPDASSAGDRDAELPTNFANLYAFLSPFHSDVVTYDVDVAGHFGCHAKIRDLGQKLLHLWVVALRISARLRPTFVKKLSTVWQAYSPHFALTCSDQTTMCADSVEHCMRLRRTICQKTFQWWWIEVIHWHVRIMTTDDVDVRRQLYGIAWDCDAQLSKNFAMVGRRISLTSSDRDNGWRRCEATVGEFQIPVPR